MGLPIDASVSQHDHGAATADMVLDLVLRQDRRDVRAALAVFKREERSEAKTRYDDMMVLVSSLGRSGRKYRREVTGCLRSIVSEVYSATRVTATAARHPRRGIISGVALDLTTTNSKGEPWDFKDPARRTEAD